MSTVFYGYEVDKPLWWAFTKEVREFYEQNYPFCRGIKKLADKRKSAEVEEAVKILGEIADLSKRTDAHVHLQVFDFDDWYIFRVLESGYFFMNNHTNFKLITPRHYDNRTDVPEEDEENEELSDWVDEQIKQHLYFIYPVVDEDSLWEIALR